MQIIPLSLEQNAACGYTHLVKITHADLTEATVNTAQVIELLNVDAFDEVQRMAMHLVTPFADASDAAFNNVAITSGDGGSANRFLTSTQINVNGTEILGFSGTHTTAYVYLAADTVDLTVGSMADKALADIDVGELWIFLKVGRLAAIG